ncbi:FAD-dependent oxidoreductase [Nonomuraea sp. B10E15]|uniref:FAD-dependent oxidoreductase n=1 Tax=Nonomuraea sp. B10E15 TaxID=3153560 RepID=UPI00325D4A76
MKVVIVGAGIAGLAAAVRLHRAGWEVIVLEHAPRLRDGGYVVNFSGLGYEAADRMGILPALQEHRVVYDWITHMNASGRCARISARAQDALGGNQSYNLMRGDIERTLFDALDGGVDIRYGCTVSHIDQLGGGVRAWLSDGTVERADLLIGADGLHSAVRRLVCGPEERYRHDLNHLVAVFAFDTAPAGLAPRTSTSLNVDGRQVAVANVPGRGALALFSHRTTRQGAELSAGARATLSRVYGDLGWVVPELLARMPDDGSGYFDGVSQIRMDRWSRGRVVLLGDAAWCVTLFAGAGTSLAVGGADLLATCLERADSVEDALRAWEAQLRPQVVSKQKGRRSIHRLLALLADPRGEIEVFDGGPVGLGVPATAEAAAETAC